MNNGELLGLVPIVVIRGEGDVVATVGELEEWLVEGAVGEGNIVGFEDFKDGVR